MSARAAGGLSHYVIRGGGFGRERLRLLSRVLAPTTCDLLRRAGLSDGMVVLDLGCGGGDVMREIAALVGPSGRIVGVELDATKLDLARQELGPLRNVELRSEDARLLEDADAFDFVYARFLLTYLADREQVLARIRRALRPGGIVAVEDIDFSGHFADPPSPPFERYVRLFSEVVKRRGGDPDVGPKLPRLLIEAGFADVGVSVVQPAFRTGEGKEIAAVTLDGITDSVVSDGLATPEEIAELVRELEAYAARPDTVLSLPRIVQTWGTRS